MWFNYTGYHTDISRRNSSVDPQQHLMFFHFGIFDPQGGISPYAWLCIVGVVSDRVKDTEKKYCKEVSSHTMQLRPAHKPHSRAANDKEIDKEDFVFKILKIQLLKNTHNFFYFISSPLDVMYCYLHFKWLYLIIGPLKLYMKRWKQKLFFFFLLLPLYPLLLLQLGSVACKFWSPFTAVVHKRKI